MSESYIWRPNGGNYYSPQGYADTAAYFVFYAVNRAFRLDFPELGALLGKGRKTIAIQSAKLRLTIISANAATLTMGYNYETAYEQRTTLLAEKTGIVMNTQTGDMEIDLTQVVRAYCREGSNNPMRLWAYGTAGSTTYSYARGYSPAASLAAQRPYLDITFAESSFQIHSGGEWKSAAPYIYKNGAWQPASVQFARNGAWQ